MGTGKTYYFDDVTFITGTGTNTPLATFDERSFDNTQSQPSVLNGFGGEIGRASCRERVWS